MKKVLIAMAFCFMAGVASAQEVTAIDLNAPLADARIGLAWNHKGEQLGVAYVPLMYWVSSIGDEYATFNLGATDKLATGKAGYLISAGPRIDTLFRNLAGSKFAQKHLRFAVLPPLQVNINMVTSDFKVYTPHLSICTRFGGK